MIGVSGGLDSTHALIVAAKAFDRLGLPRDEHPRLHHAGLRHQRGHQGQRLALMQALRRHRRTRSTSARPRRQMLADMGHPFAEGEPVYDVTFENVQAGLRTDYLFRLANQHERLRPRHRRPLGAGARLVHLRRRRPDEPLQRQLPACRRR